ncbi:helix-turn-helix domain-containing protein, partial [Frankia sp. AiPs1]|uniref:helix-turn-helix domain-containing protein n=1 Tax=Frankia sp. AiPs1 TaxID=573493 RepID=UPI00204495C5
MRALGWSYRRIARRLQARHRLGALVAFRLAHGWTQEEAARRWNERWPGRGPAKTGKTWSYWESWPGKGGRAPSATVLARLAELYLCRPGDLLDGPDFGQLDPGADGGDDRTAA